ncbi:NADH:ubiquinone oxidoreductase subunit K [Okibacterium sp. HSC-33S16]|uniref:hypothetical protein n=1 Tax=Okibacterium sp. HSC-33S16 TaxID=2910965 RepID=UPI0020A03235|nr:hypothetical protein [Okibacterium sp. HSC-33S16]MCP2032638.1 NADH:ubiquinone oxidoreductase subunit K [Okibacterium sp. HSC-33S16]
MGKLYALMLGIVLGTHGLVGLFIEGEHLLAILNVDIFIDVVYLVSAVLLLGVALTNSSPGAIRGSLLLVGVVLLAIGVSGLFDNTVFGLMPTGLTLVDYFLFFGAGFVSLILPAFPSSVQPLTSSGTALN